MLLIQQHHTENKTLCHEFVTDLMGNLSDTSRTGWERFVTGKVNINTAKRKTVIRSFLVRYLNLTISNYLPLAS